MRRMIIALSIMSIILFSGCSTIENRQNRIYTENFEFGIYSTEDDIERQKWESEW
jgi:uncharacterized protein YceK